MHLFLLLFAIIPLAAVVALIAIFYLFRVLRHCVILHLYANHLSLPLFSKFFPTLLLIALLELLDSFISLIS